MSCTQTSLMEVIAKHGGVVASGAHSADYTVPDCELCILEMHAACLVDRGELAEITDDPEILGRPDYRRINDARWSSRAVATPHLVRLHMAYDGWAVWSETRRKAITDRIAIETVRRIVAELPRLSDSVRAKCRAVTTLEEARAAAYAAVGAAAAAAAAYAAAADAVYAAAAYAAAADAADKVLITAVDIWCEAKQEQPK